METPPLEVTRAAGDLRALIGRLSRRLRQTSVVGEMTLSQASVLSLLEREGPATPGILATREHISPQSMGALSLSHSPRQDSRQFRAHDDTGKSDSLVPLPITSLPKSNRCLSQHFRSWNAWRGCSKASCHIWTCW